MKTRKTNKEGLMISPISNEKNVKILVKHLSNQPVVTLALESAAKEMNCNVHSLLQHYYGAKKKETDYSKSMLCRANLPIVTISGGKNYCFVNGKLTNGKQFGKAKNKSFTKKVFKQMFDEWFK